MCWAPDIDEAQAPQIVVPPHAWQSARSLGDYTLVGCTVAPGFEFAHFEMAPDGFAAVNPRLWEQWNKLRRNHKA